MGTEREVNVAILSKVMENVRPGDLDRVIIACLSEDSRAPFARIGEQVGLSASAVKRRVDRLVRDGVIRQFTIAVDPARIGWHVESFVELTCEGQTSAVEIRELLSRHVEVIAAWTVTGEVNALLQVLTVDVAHLEETLEQIRYEPKVLKTQTVVVLSRLINRALADPGERT